MTGKQFYTTTNSMRFWQKNAMKEKWLVNHIKTLRFCMANINRFVKQVAKAKLKVMLKSELCKWQINRQIQWKSKKLIHGHNPEITYPYDQDKTVTEAIKIESKTSESVLIIVELTTPNGSKIIFNNNNNNFYSHCSGKKERKTKKV